MGDDADDRRNELRMWLAVRRDLDMPPGKLAVQSGHAFATALLSAHVREPRLVEEYQAAQMSKAVVGVKTLAQLRRVESECIAAGLDHCLVTDAGRTVFGGPTETVCAFGPCRMSDLPPFLGRLRLLEDPRPPSAGARDAVTPPGRPVTGRASLRAPRTRSRSGPGVTLR